MTSLFSRGRQPSYSRKKARRIAANIAKVTRTSYVARCAIFWIEFLLTASTQAIMHLGYPPLQRFARHQSVQPPPPCAKAGKTPTTKPIAVAIRSARSCASPLSYESFGDMRPVPSCRKKHNQDCEHEPRARAHKSVLHTHGMTALEVEENSLIGVSE
jgi:hypothetical protein